MKELVHCNAGSNVVVWSPTKEQFFDLNKDQVISIGTVQDGTIELPPKRSFYIFSCKGKKLAIVRQASMESANPHGIKDDGRL